MTRLKWDRAQPSSILNSEYFTSPKKGFDSAWHTQKAKLNAGLGEHSTHDWKAIQINSGPHKGKAICNTCNGKFIMWLPKGYFTNT